MHRSYLKREQLRIWQNTVRTPKHKLKKPDQSRVRWIKRHPWFRTESLEIPKGMKRGKTGKFVDMLNSVYLLAEWKITTFLQICKNCRNNTLKMATSCHWASPPIPLRPSSPAVATSDHLKLGPRPCGPLAKCGTRYLMVFWPPHAVFANSFLFLGQERQPRLGCGPPKPHCSGSNPSTASD